MTPFDLAYHHATPHGILAAVHLPDSPEPVSDDVMARLAPAEREHAASLRGFRQVQFVGGRLALQAAARQLGLRIQPVLPDDRGAPQLPEGFVGSVSHKRTIAVGMVARDTQGTLGVDIEDYGPERLSIASRVLRPAELAEIETSTGSRQWMGLLIRFSIKESIYKAIDPWVRRYVGFHEAEVTIDLDGTAQVALFLERGEGPFLVDARYAWLHRRLLTSVRIRPVGTGP